MHGFCKLFSDMLLYTHITLDSILVAGTPVRCTKVTFVANWFDTGYSHVCCTHSNFLMRKNSKKWFQDFKKFNTTLSPGGTFVFEWLTGAECKLQDAMLVCHWHIAMKLVVNAYVTCVPGLRSHIYLNVVSIRFTYSAECLGISICNQFKDLFAILLDNSIALKTVRYRSQNNKQNVP
jgi:hypothetical protein